MIVTIDPSFGRHGVPSVRRDGLPSMMKREAPKDPRRVGGDAVPGLDVGAWGWRIPLWRPLTTGAK